MPLTGSWFWTPLVSTWGGEYSLWLQSSVWAPGWQETRSVNGALAVSFWGTAMPGKSAPVMTIGSTARFGATVGSTTGSGTCRGDGALQATPAPAQVAASATA